LEVDSCKAIISTQAIKIQELEEELRVLKKKLYGSSSERGRDRKSSSGGGGKPPGSNPPKTRDRSLTKQYPDAEVEECVKVIENPPSCPCCQNPMEDSGLEEVSERLYTIPAQHKIIRYRRRKYKCGRCYSALVTAPLEPRVAPRSSMEDSFIFSAAIAKFHDLIPAERYAEMLSRGGLRGLPPQLILSAQHYLAVFLKSVYELFKKSIQQSPLLYSDESRHRLLEGGETKNGYIWCFSANGISCFEIHETRSADVSIDFLVYSECVFFMSDIFTGYIKTIRVVNEKRRALGLREIVALFCNAHCRRRFDEARIDYEQEAQFFIDCYESIYRLDKELKVLVDPVSRLQKRSEMRPYFEEMLAYAKKVRDQFSDKSSLARALDYFTNHYEGFTRFLEHPDLPIDNNLSERQLRSPVIGRKTWYGTHSKRGVETTEILFTILQSCKSLKVNPYEYLVAVSKALFKGEAPFTPAQFLAETPDRKKA
jgi:transposase